MSVSCSELQNSGLDSFDEEYVVEQNGRFCARRFQRHLAGVWTLQSDQKRLVRLSVQCLSFVYPQDVQSVFWYLLYSGGEARLCSLWNVWSLTIVDGGVAIWRICTDFRGIESAKGKKISLHIKLTWRYFATLEFALRSLGWEAKGSGRRLGHSIFSATWT